MSSAVEAPADRFQRQAGLVPHDRLVEVAPTVIGVGAVGRQVALQLASIGVPRLQIFDFDIVEETNITTQGYHCDELTQPKVEATSREIHRIDHNIDLVAINDRFKPKYEVGNAVFICVDSISAREAIWRSLKDKVDFWVDARMLGETIRVLTSQPRIESQAYASTLFTQAEAHAGACTSRSTVYAANIAASLMIHQFTRWLRDIPTDNDVMLNLLSSEMTVE